MPEVDPVLIFVLRLNRLEVPYMVTGSVASMAYGEPRLTHDIDLVVELRERDIGLLELAFPAPEFYCPPAEVIRAEVERLQRGHFNLIHLETGFKADLYPIGRDPLHLWAMPRRRRIETVGIPILLAPPEYVIIRKLEYFREGGSEKHLRDIRNMIAVSGALIDWAELKARIADSHLEDAWTRAEERKL
jgi:hypothetical protein